MIASALLAFNVGGWRGRLLDTARAPRVGSLAVLPLLNPSGDPQEDYLADGITEGVIGKLSEIPEFRVMSRNSVFRFKGKEPDARAAGRDLKVQAVLTGRVTRQADVLTISAELVNVTTGMRFNNSSAPSTWILRSLAHLFLADLLAEVGSYEEAIKERQKSGLLLGESPEEAGAVAAEFHEALRTGGPKGYWQENLELTLTRYRKSGAVYFPAITVAGAYAKAGDKENAFRWLEKSYQDREGQDITLLTSLPNFKNLRGDLRFADLLRRMRLPN